MVIETQVGVQGEREIPKNTPWYRKLLEDCDGGGILVNHHASQLTPEEQIALERLVDNRIEHKSLNSVAKQTVARALMRGGISPKAAGQTVNNLVSNLSVVNLAGRGFTGEGLDPTRYLKDGSGRRGLGYIQSMPKT